MNARGKTQSSIVKGRSVINLKPDWFIYFVLILIFWGACVPEAPHQLDMNDDGCINESDLLRVITYWTNEDPGN